jgi:hypothetical protein
VRGDPPGDLPELLDDALRLEKAELSRGVRVDHQFEIPGAVVSAATGGAFDGWPLNEAWVFRALLPGRAE